MTVPPTDGVVPFDPNRRRRGRPPAPPPPDAHKSLHRRTQRAAPAARELALQQAAQAREKYAAAAARQEADRLLADETPVPAWISTALNMGGHEGPEVDRACGTWEGNPDGDVDQWEAAEAVPTAAQVRLLAELTGWPVAFFYRPFTPGPLLGDGRMWICWTGKRGCQSPEPDWIDDRGVLHYGDEPGTAPAATQTALF